MDLYKFNKKKNKSVFSCWLIISIVLSIAYTIEYFKGSRTLYYVVQYFMFTWAPLIISYGISLIIGRGNLNIKYGITIGYLIFYVYTQLTSQSPATFTYIIPMMCAIIVYDDIRLLNIYSISAIIINVIDILIKMTIHNQIYPNNITFFEIQLACLILSAIFLHKTTKLLVYSNDKLMKLNEDIAKDELTNIYNRYFLKGFLDRKFKNPEFSELSLAIIDIDSFKSINDNYGHKFGDLVLRKIATILKENISEYEETYPIRVGGDEFMIISSLIDKEMMYNICTNICEEISNTKLKYGEKKVTITVSIGVASNKTDKCNSYNKLYETADSLLYTVKNNGKSSVAKN